MKNRADQRFYKDSVILYAQLETSGFSNPNFENA